MAPRLLLMRTRLHLQPELYLRLGSVHVVPLRFLARNAVQIAKLLARDAVQIIVPAVRQL